MSEERTDTASYEDDYRDRQGPIVFRVVTEELLWEKYFDVGYCPKCLARLSWNRTFCFADERDTQCAECLTVWLEPDEIGEANVEPV